MKVNVIPPNQASVHYNVCLASQAVEVTGSERGTIVVGTTPLVSVRLNNEPTLPPQRPSGQHGSVVQLPPQDC